MRFFYYETNAGHTTERKLCSLFSEFHRDLFHVLDGFVGEIWRQVRPTQSFDQLFVIRYGIKWSLSVDAFPSLIAGFLRTGGFLSFFVTGFQNL